MPKIKTKATRFVRKAAVRMVMTGTASVRIVGDKAAGYRLAAERTVTYRDNGVYQEKVVTPFGPNFPTKIGAVAHCERQYNVKPRKDTLPLVA